MGGALPSISISLEENNPTFWTPSYPTLWSLCPAEEYSRRLLQLLSLTGSWQAEAGGGRSRGALGLLLTCLQALPVLGPSCAHPGTAEAATNCIACSSKQLAEDQSQAVSYIGLHQSPSQEAQCQHIQGPASDNIRTGSRQLLQVAYPKGDLSRHQTLLKRISLQVVSTCTAAHMLWSGLSLIVSQPEG